MKRNNYRLLNIAAVLATACLAGPALASDSAAVDGSTTAADEMEEITVVGSKTEKHNARVRSVDNSRPEAGRPRWQFFPAYEPAPRGYRFIMPSRDHYGHRESITLFRLRFGR